jgi:hypothetical protein
MTGILFHFHKQYALYNYNQLYIRHGYVHYKVQIIFPQSFSLSPLGRDGVVAIATRYGPEGPGIGSR